MAQINITRVQLTDTINLWRLQTNLGLDAIQLITQLLDTDDQTLTITGDASVDNLIASGNGTFSGTEKLRIPVGTVAQRPGSPAVGDVRYNSDSGEYEAYKNGNWQNFQSIESRTFKNKIIGGDFSLNPWQRGTSFTAPTSNDYTADRWEVFNNTSAVFNVLKTADAPTVTQAGVFTQHCLHVDVTTADTSILAGDLVLLRHKVEGYNIIDLGFGQSGTRYAAVSFWHKHTKTGTHCVTILNNVQNRNHIKEYTQTTSNVWEFAFLIFPVDTSGTWLYDNNIGIRLEFVIAAGTNFQGSADTWQAGNLLVTSNQVNNLDSTANNFKIALVQLEQGQNATSFERRSVKQEIELCQRYAELIQVPGTSYLGQWSSVGNFYGISQPFKVEKRATPTISLVNTGGLFYWVEPGIANYSANTTSSINFTQSKTSWALQQGRTPGGSTPVPREVYILEPPFDILANSEL